MKKYAPQFWIAVAGVAMTLLGLLGPWVKLISFVSISVSGFDAGDGKIVATLLVCAAAALVSYARGSRPNASLVFGVILGGLIAIIGFYEVIHVGSVANGTDYAVSVGWGLYATVIGGGAIFGGTLRTLLASRKHVMADLTLDELHLGIAEMEREAS